MYSDKYDSLLIRCPRLGGEVTFAYCRAEGGELPCARIVGCWQVCLPIAGYLEEALTLEQAGRFREQRPREKIVSLIELIEATKRECL
ncbi:MAG TPA: hypothetical protein VMJ66_13985 [Geobacteraceae bacterium]|nr:hypothetical protein [Geobacteraceae bacterium]